LIRPFIEMTDLRQPITTPPFDLVICTEVGEHLEKEHADTLIRNVADAAKTWIFFSAATPGQGGMAHFNEQPHEYWIEKFLTQGFVLKKDETASMREYLKGIAACWFTNNALILRRSG
jgi:2-polyprenyl-3-methyl-5-hydroxy-6-metoxy-1,4-benzoquinol methylase